MTVPNYECICDTNIWVNLCLGDVHSVYFEKFNIVGIADAVKNEIIKWERHEGDSKRVFSLFHKYKDKNLFIINRNELDSRIKSIIEFDLRQEGFVDLDNSNKTIENLGEFVSFLYAYHLEVPFIHSDDTSFSHEIQSEEVFSRYKGIEIVTWNEIAETLTDNHDDRLRLNKIVQEKSTIMRKQFVKEKEERKLQHKINQLAKRFSKR